MIEVIASGPLNTVQDLGRRGLRRFGVGTAGAMDDIALRIGNHLVGNDAGAAGIEVQTFPFELRFDAPMQIAVTGAHSPKNRLGNRPLIPWWSYRVNSGETLSLAYPQDGARTYVTFAGGLDVPLVLGSRSTQLRDGFGGFGGRALAKGDRLRCGASEQPVAVELGATPPHAVLPVPLSGDALSVRAIPGADYEAFTEAARSALWNREWSITSQSDRAGYRLQGEPLQLVEPMELRSYGVVPGIVQVPRSGLPIIQLSDANTAGGYPRIAGVIGPDLWRLAQAPLGSRIRFIQIDYAGAVAVMQQVEAYLDDVRRTAAAVRNMQHRLADRPVVVPQP